MEKIELAIQIIKIVLIAIAIGIGVYFISNFPQKENELQPRYSPLEGYGASSTGGEWIFTEKGWKK